MLYVWYRPRIEAVNRDTPGGTDHYDLRHSRMAMAATVSEPAVNPSLSPLENIGINIFDNPGLWVEQVLENLVHTLKTFLPNLLAALALLLLGWLAAFVIRWLVQRFGKGLDALLALVHRWFGQEVSRPRWSVSDLVGHVAFWMVLVYGVSAAAEQVGLATFASWLRELLGYLPTVLISAFILFMGYLVSNGVRNAIAVLADTSGFQHGASLGHLTSGLILAFALLLGMDQLGLDVDLFSNIIVLAAGALFGSAALAFGIGAGDAVRNVMASHYVRKTYRPGQRVRINGLEGEILELTQFAVLVETDQGEALVPARHFLESVSVAVEGEGSHSA